MNNTIKIVIFLIVAVVSVFVIAPKAKQPESYKATIETLNKKQTNVLELTAAASAASVVLGAVPGDATTPIANKVIDMAGYFIIILSVIILEKYFLTIAGYLTFTWLIPIACGLFILNVFLASGVIRQLALKVLALGVCIFLLVPISVKVSDVIEQSNEVSINTKIENVKEIQKEAEKITGKKSEKSTEKSTEKSEEDSKGVIDYIFNMKEGIEDLVDDTKEKIEDTTSAVAQLSEEVIKKAQDTMNDFVEIVVVMLVTTCGIPILTLLLLVWIVKTILGIDFDKLMEKNASWRKVED